MVYLQSYATITTLNFGMFSSLWKETLHPLAISPNLYSWETSLVRNENTLLQVQQATLFEYKLVKMIVFSSDKNPNQIGLDKRRIYW